MRPVYTGRIFLYLAVHGCRFCDLFAKKNEPDACTLNPFYENNFTLIQVLPWSAFHLASFIQENFSFTSFAGN